MLGDGVRGASHWPSLWAPVLWLWRGCPGPFLKSHVCFDEMGTRAKEERLCVMESSRFGPGPGVMFVFASCRSEEGHFGGRKVSFRPQEPPYHIRGGHRGTEGLCLGSKAGVPSSRRRRKGHLFSLPFPRGALVGSFLPSCKGTPVRDATCVSDTQSKALLQPSDSHRLDPK